MPTRSRSESQAFMAPSALVLILGAVYSLGANVPVPAGEPASGLSAPVPTSQPVHVMPYRFPWPADTTDWPQWRGPQRDSISTEKNLNLDWNKTPPRDMWRINVGDGYSSVAVVKDRLYTVGWGPRKGGQETVYCLNAETGEKIWTTSYLAEMVATLWTGPNFAEWAGVRATPCVDGDRVYTLSGDGRAMCLDAGTGGIIWQENLEQAVHAVRPHTYDNCQSPIVLGRVAVFGVGDCGVGVDKMTGKILWGWKGGEASYGSPVPLTVNGRDCVTMQSEDQGRKCLFSIVDAENGQVLWQYPFTHTYSTEAVFLGDQVLLGAGYGFGASLVALHDGKLIWHSKNLQPHMHTPIVHEGFIYSTTMLKDYSENYACFDLKDCSVKWISRENSTFAAILAQGKLIVHCDGSFMVVDLSPQALKIEGKYKTQVRSNFGMHALSDGRLYTRGEKGGLLCVDIRAPGHPRYAQTFHAATQPAGTATQPALISTPFAKPSSSDWFQGRGPQRDGISPLTGLQLDWTKGQPKDLWRAEVGFGFSPMIVAGDRVYTLSWSYDDHRESISCLDAKTGGLIWRTLYETKNIAKIMDETRRHHFTCGPRAAPALDNDRLYVLDQAGEAVCLDAATGQILWKKSLPKEFELTDRPAWFYSGSPLVLDKEVVFAVGTAGAALDKATGNTVWLTGKDACGNASPVAFARDGKQCLALFGKEALFILDSADGKTLWKYPWSDEHGENRCDPIMVGKDQVLVCGGYGKGAALLTVSSDQLVWQQKALDPQEGTPVLYQGFIYGPSQSEHGLVCLDAKDGAVKWRQPMDAAHVVLADGKLIVQGRTGEVHIVVATPAGFKPLGTCRVLESEECGIAPSVSGGRLFCRSWEGEVVALDLTSLVPLAAPAAPPDPRQADALLTQLSATRQADREAAAAALAKIARSDGPRLIPVLVDLLRKDHWLTQSSASETLQKIGPSAQAAISDLAAMAVKDIQARDWSLVILLSRTIRAVDPSDQTVYAKVTGDLTDALLILLDDKDESLVRAATTALGALGSAAKKALPRLTEILAKPPRLSSVAVAALVSIVPNGQEAVPVLVGAAKRISDLGARREIQSALDKIKTGNVPPTAEDGEIKGKEGQTLPIKLRVSDEDDVASLLWISVVAKPAHGKTAVKKDSALIEYTPDEGYVGKDTFTWKARDAKSESPTATVTVEVEADTTVPVVMKAEAQADLNGVIVIFSKSMDQTSAEMTTNYKLDPEVKIEKAALNAEGKTVTLTTSKLKEKQEYALTVSNLHDRTSKANAVPTTPIKFQAGAK